jgi:protein-tyrosine phosphatase
MLAALLIRELARQGLSRFTVESAGTYASIGERASEHAIEVMKARGIDISGHISRGRLIVCVTKAHETAVRTLYPELRDDVIKVIPRGVPDPYGQSVAMYEACAETLQKAAEAIAHELKREEERAARDL